MRWPSEHRVSCLQRHLQRLHYDHMQMLPQVLPAPTQSATQLSNNLLVTCLPEAATEAELAAFFTPPGTAQVISIGGNALLQAPAVQFRLMHVQPVPCDCLGGAVQICSSSSSA